MPGSLAIPATMLVAFVLSVTFLWEQGQRTSQAAGAAAPLPLLPAPPAVPKPVIAVAAAPSAKPVARAEVEEPPIVVVVRNRRRLDEVEATAQNTSDRPMSVTLAAEDVEGEVVSRARLDLSPGEARRFGANDGIDLPRGGRLRVSTPDFDEVVDIPL